MIRRRLLYQLSTGLVIAASVALPACSVLTRGASGAQAYGVALQRSIELAQGTCRRVHAPGIGLRLLPDVWGLSIGWHEVLVFYPSSSQVASVEPVATATRAVGFDVGARGLTIGVGREFLVRGPKGAHVLQEIHFHETRLAESVVWRKEIK